MFYVLSFLVGLALGAGFYFFLSMDARRRLTEERTALLQLQDRIAKQREALRVQEDAARRAVTLTELERENILLKRDLSNLDVQIHKLELDRDLDREARAALETKVRALAERYLDDNVKWISRSLNTNNFVVSKQRLLKLVEEVREIGFEVPPKRIAELTSALQAEFETVVRAALAREEQARIKARLREEEQLRRETERELRQLEREREAIRAALDKALAESREQHTQEIERLQARLAEAEAKCQRAVSQAQMTRAGHVYVLSNIGSFGENVYKIGMTRRLDPQERVRELGDASVPFPFDVHMMIFSEDAPALENALHAAFHKSRVNRINPRKEFFRVTLEEILEAVKRNFGEVQYVAEPEALEYRQGLIATDEDVEFVASLYDDEDDENQRSYAA